MSRPLPLLGALLACTLALPAHAFTGDQDHPEGAEPTRLMHYTPTVQRDLLQDPAWQEFLAGEGQGWTVRFDEATGEPFRMYGRGIDLGPLTDLAHVERALRAFLGRHTDVIPLSPKALGAARGSYSEVTDTWYVDIPVSYEGAPVWRGGITARFKAGKLVMLGAQTYDGTPREGEVLLTDAEAITMAIGYGLAPDADHTDIETAPAWLPFQRGGELVLVRTIEVRSVTDDPPGRWVSFVDAETGEVLATWNEVRFFTGTLTGRHHVRTLDDPLVSSPLRGMSVVASNSRQTYTDDAGQFTLDDTSFTLELETREFIVNDRRDNRTYTRTFGTDDVELVSGTGVSLAEISTFVFLDEIKDWGDAVAPDVRVTGRNGNRLVSNVNDNSGSCNAFYNGTSVNFYVAGRGCNNTGTIADVNYHEWGHGFHASSLRAGAFDGALSEGAADTVSFLQTNDNIIAPTFVTDGRGIRNVEPDRVYPRDVVNQVHTDGLIFGGAMWDLKKALTPRYGEEGALRVSGELLAGALKGGPTLAAVGEEILVADDDDGDLSNGTPHFCEIVEAFGAHGLLPQTGVSALLAHEQLVEEAPEDGIDISARVAGLELECVQIDNVDVVWRAGGSSGTWERTAATISGGNVTASLPDLPFGTFVEYYLESGAAGDAVQVPPGGVRNPLSLYVGGVLDLGLCNDFEADDGGYTSELLAGEDREGADDWQWGEPGGRGGDPAMAFSGVNAWGNDLGNDPQGRWNGQYQNERHNRLTTPELTFPEHLEGVFLRYARWLQVEDAVFDRAQILADGEVVWTNHDSGNPDGGAHHLEDRWVMHSVDLGEATADGAVTLAWEIRSDQGLAFGGWTLDDVCVFAPATPNNRLAILDFQASDDTEGGVSLTWTNPEHAPLREVVVVRNEDAIPTGPDDGEVVFRDDAPELGAPVEAFDDSGRSGREYHYAVFAGDGADWLGWAVEGRNVDQGSGTGQPRRGILAAGGCSCTTTGSSTGSGLAVLALGLLALARRRRRH